MQHEDWQKRWQQNEIGFNQPQPNELLQRYFSLLNGKPGDRVFVPLCGKSIDMLWLANQGYEVIGVELSRKACEDFFEENRIAVNRVKKDKFLVFQSEKITLLAGDFFQLDRFMLGDVSAIYDRAALIALSKDIRPTYVEHMFGLVSSNTPILLITTFYNQAQMNGPPFSVGEEEVALLFSRGYDIKQVYNRMIQALPEHLRVKGLVQAQEQVYYLLSK